MGREEIGGAGTREGTRVASGASSRRSRRLHNGSKNWVDFGELRRSREASVTASKVLRSSSLRQKRASLESFSNCRYEVATPGASTIFLNKTGPFRRFFPAPPTFLQNRRVSGGPTSGSPLREMRGSSACSAALCSGPGVQPVPESPAPGRRASPDGNERVEARLVLGVRNSLIKQGTRSSTFHSTAVRISTFRCVR